MSGKYNGSQKKTWYDGFLYDSTLESQWAFFWDEVGIKFVPHPASFKTGKKYGNGEEIIYTPDFYLCEENLYCEVKPTDALLKDRETQRKISAAIDKNYTPIGHGLLILGAMSNFNSNLSKKICLKGEFYQWIGGSIVKSFWTIGKNNFGEAKTHIFLDEPLWDSECIYSNYPYLGNPSAYLARYENDERASEIVYKAIFDAIYASDNGILKPENTDSTEFIENDQFPFD